MGIGLRQTVMILQWLLDGYMRFGMHHRQTEEPGYQCLVGPQPSRTPGRTTGRLRPELDTTTQRSTRPTALSVEFV